MSKSEPFRGVLPPVVTPFNADLEPDREAFVAHCRWLLGQGADGLAVFGTTSEANSLSGDERMALLDALVQRMPEGPVFYGEEEVTDRPLRFLAACSRTTLAPCCRRPLLQP